jgi:hypothetical protein
VILVWDILMLSIEQLMKEALSLPNALTAQLAERLVESLEFDLVVSKLEKTAESFGFELVAKPQHLD